MKGQRSMTVTSRIFESMLMIKKINTLQCYKIVIKPYTQPGPKELSYESEALDYEIKAALYLPPFFLSFVIHILPPYP